MVIEEDIVINDPSCFSSLGGLDRIQHQIGVLLRAGLVSYNTVVIEITDDREIEEALSCADVRDIRYPLLVWPFGDKVSVQQVGITVQSFSVLYIPLSANFALFKPNLSAICCCVSPASASCLTTVTFPALFRISLP